MAIVSSTYDTDHSAQSGGGRWVVESHTETSGAVHTLIYLWDGSSDRDKPLATHASGLSAQLAEAEASAILDE